MSIGQAVESSSTNEKATKETTSTSKNDTDLEQGNVDTAVSLESGDHSDKSHELARSKSNDKSLTRSHESLLATKSHSPPLSIKITNIWPRDPDGADISPSVSSLARGKTTPSGLPWAASVLHWCWYYSSPKMEDVKSKATISQLAEWMKANGELYADAHLQTAAEEPDPMLQPPYDVRKLLLENERLPMELKGRVHPEHQNGSAVKSQDENLPSNMFVTAEYIPRFIPFTSPSVYIQERISMDMLPQKLIVHDPYFCLKAKGCNYTNKFKDEDNNQQSKWGTNEDVIRVYKLSLTEDSSYAKCDKKEVSQAEEGPADSSNEVLNASDPTPRVPVAHLYMSPSHMIGIGNHSYVYEVEWEVPRSMLFSDSTDQLNGSAMNDHENMEQQSETCTIRVAAKLGVRYDSHLENEAVESYPHFPEHFFESYTGFHCCDPFHNPVPATAIVPQFYGFYVPEEDEEEENDDDDGEEDVDEYLSPILLLEHCGKSVNVDELSKDNREQCISLLLRFHSGGWQHYSFYPRNIVQQPGPLYKHPSERSNDWPSFRLIDFGSSEDHASEYNREYEIRRAFEKMSLERCKA